MSKEALLQTHTCNTSHWFTRIQRLSLVSIHDEPVPGSAQHSTHLGHGKRIGVLTHWGGKETKQGEEEKKTWGWMVMVPRGNGRVSKNNEKWESGTFMTSYPGRGHCWPAGWAWGWVCQWRGSVAAALRTATTGATGRTRTAHSSGNSPLNTWKIHMKPDINFMGKIKSHFLICTCDILNSCYLLSFHASWEYTVIFMSQWLFPCGHHFTPSTATCDN